MASHAKCKFNYLELFNGPNASFPPIGKYCGTATPEGFQSHSKSVGIVFITDSDVINKGFNMTYTFTQDCPHVINSVNCSNKCHCLVGPCDNVTGACGNGGCKDGWNGTACNETCPLGSYSVNCSKQCHCRFGPCDGVTGACGNDGCKEGWTGEACNEKCGGVLTDSFGVITSPNFPSNYSNDVECNWVINAPEGYMINFNFTEFALEYDFDCDYDYIQLFQGPDASSPLIEKVCGTVQSIVFKSQSNSAFIIFSTDSGISARGFNLTYRFSVQRIIYLGCYEFSRNFQDFEGHSGWTSPAECLNFCNLKETHYQFSGVMDSRHCRCFNTLQNTIQRPASECDGEILRMNIYSYGDCSVGNYSVNCSKQCNCREGPCDGFTGSCRNRECKDGWKGNACNESCPLGSFSVNCSKKCHCRLGPCDDVTGACGKGDCKDGWTGKACNENCTVGSYSVNCSKQCNCREGPCDGFTGSCGNGECKDGWKGNACNETDEVKEQSSTIMWIAPTLALCLLIVVVTITACLCIRRKKKKREQKAVQLNELRPSDIPLELIDSNSGNYDVFPYDNNDDNTDNYDVIPDDNNYDNTDHYDVLPDDNNDDKTDPYDALPDDVHDDFVVPYAVVPLDNTEREATPMYRSLQSQITDDYLHTGLGDSSYMIPASSYVLGRICESKTTDQTHSAVAEELDNAATLEIQYKASLKK